MFGVQPSKYRSSAHVNPNYLFPARTIEHLEFLQNHQILPPAFMELDQVQVAGLMSRIEKEHQSVNQLWHTLEAILTDSGFSENVRYYGITTYPQDWVETGVFYMAAVAGLDTDYPALVSKSLPSGGYACFQHQASEEALQMLRAEIYQTWLPKSGKRFAMPMEIEVYGDLGYLPDCPRQIYIPLA